MSLFLLIASTHFLALLSPGPDFFLIARSTLAHGRWVASGACAGVALANGLYISLALTGFARISTGSPLFVLLQGAGGLYLLYLGVTFLQVAHHTAGQRIKASEASTGGWWHHALLGLLSGLLNPKNALFYASLASVLASSHAGTGLHILLGLWMFLIVLLWDLFITVLIGHPLWQQRIQKHLPRIEQLCGLLLCLIAAAALFNVAQHLVTN
ncbi:lysine transporter LysE [Alcaligenes faecalis]|uniref:LysE family translocator n=1 Tax=Alcaligenes faecalis TaxID=511 RepID=UPI000752276D|nr:LysE family translocator [Alcaligenes faecalis]KVX04914.1 lysine transporter LysE [Alcaligenes faecalis]ULH06820.1 LysE family translocator [Alcaligenes faecalis]